VWVMRALAGALVAVSLCVGIAHPVHAKGDGCGIRGFDGRICSHGGITDSGVILDGHLDAPGATTLESPRLGRSSSGSQGSAVPTPPVTRPVTRRDRLAADVDVPCVPGTGSCGDGHHAFLPPAKAPATPPVPAPAPPAADPAVTLEDVARFVPRSASIRSQPNGWAMVGAPVNLLTDASPQVIDGTLLGRPAQVRFAPVAFTWDHGDGTSTTVEGPGALWRDLRQPDFTSTPTSHVYDTVGDRQVTLSIGYAPSYRFDGGGWQQIPGVLPVQVGPVGIRVLQGSTVLVGGVCGAPDAGPGC
jgi:hypothetical protein